MICLSKQMEDKLDKSYLEDKPKFLVNSYVPYERINRINYYEVVDLMEKLSL